MKTFNALQSLDIYYYLSLWLKALLLVRENINLNYLYKQYLFPIPSNLCVSYIFFHFVKMKPQEKMFFKDPVKLVQTRLENIGQVSVIFCLSKYISFVPINL